MRNSEIEELRVIIIDGKDGELKASADKLRKEGINVKYLSSHEEIAQRIGTHPHIGIVNVAASIPQYGDFLRQSLPGIKVRNTAEYIRLLMKMRAQVIVCSIGGAFTMEDLKTMYNGVGTECGKNVRISFATSLGAVEECVRVFARVMSDIVKLPVGEECVPSQEGSGPQEQKKEGGSNDMWPGNALVARIGDETRKRFERFKARREAAQR